MTHAQPKDNVKQIEAVMQTYIEGGWTGHRFTDFFTLAEVDGQWQIMSKVFYLHPSD